MRLTRFSDYSLRTLLYLAMSGEEKVSIAQISAAYEISENHLVKIVHQLGKLGLVETSRGRNGGLRLAKSADKIRIGDVVRQTEEDLSVVDCFADVGCTITGACRLQGVLGEAMDAFLAVLDRYTLADLLKGSQGRETARLLGLAPPHAAG